MIALIVSMLGLLLALGAVLTMLTRPGPVTTHQMSPKIILGLGVAIAAGAAWVLL